MFPYLVYRFHRPDIHLPLLWYCFPWSIYAVCRKKPAFIVTISVCTYGCDRVGGIFFYRCAFLQPIVFLFIRHMNPVTLIDNWKIVVIFINIIFPKDMVFIFFWYRGRSNLPFTGRRCFRCLCFFSLLFFFTQTSLVYVIECFLQRAFYGTFRLSFLDVFNILFDIRVNFGLLVSR